MNIEHIAKVVHEANKALCETQGDFSQPCWETAPDWQKDSAMNGIKGTIDGAIVTPEDSHKSWLAEKEADGWVYGEVKDPEKKEHPCMVPYGDLPASQRIKDHLFQAIVKALVEFEE